MLGLAFNNFAIALIVTGLLSLTVAVVVGLRMGSLFNWFSLILVSIAIWCVAYGFELTALRLSDMLFWIRIEYLGITLLPALWLVFVLKYVGQEEWLKPPLYALAFGYSLLTYLLVATNDYHHWYYQSVSVDVGGPFPLLEIEPGVWYIVHTAVFYMVIIFSFVLLVKRFSNSDRIYRRQNNLVLIAITIPWLVNIAYIVFGLKPYGHIDLTPFAFFISALLVAFGLLRLRLFEIVPLARDKIFADLQDGVLVLDNDNRVIDLNESMRALIGVSRDQILGVRAERIFTEREIQALWQTPLSLEKASLIWRKSPEEAFELTSSFLSAISGGTAGRILLFRNITPRLLAEQRLKQKSEELAALNKIKDRLFSVIAHDLRGPLASIKQLLSLFEDDHITGQELKNLVIALSKELQQSNDLLENLLAWARGQLDGEKIRLESFPVFAVVNEITEFFEKPARRKNIGFNKQIPENLSVWADRQMFRIIIRNLISNSIKFSPAASVISIVAAVDQDQLMTIAISDQGEGMSQEELNNLFGPDHFSKMGTNKEKGTGLGLLLVKDLTEKLGGEINIESEPGLGSTFTVKLPRSAT